MVRIILLYQKKFQVLQDTNKHIVKQLNILTYHNDYPKTLLG